jgi:hypothetical protein
MKPSDSHIQLNVSLPCHRLCVLWCTVFSTHLRLSMRRMAFILSWRVSCCLAFVSAPWEGFVSSHARESSSTVVGSVSALVSASVGVSVCVGVVGSLVLVWETVSTNTAPHIRSSMHEFIPLWRFLCALKRPVLTQNAVCHIQGKCFANGIEKRFLWTTKVRQYSP